MSLLRFASSLVRMLERRLISKITTLVHQEDIQADAKIISTPSWTITLFFSAKQVGWFPFPEGLSVRRSKDGRETLSFSSGFSPLLRIVFHSTLVSSGALTFCCPLYTMSILSLSFTLVPPSCSVCCSLSIPFLYNTASAVLNFFADGNMYTCKNLKNLHHFIVKLLLHRDSRRALNDCVCCHSSTRPAKISLMSKVCFVHVADLEVLVDHPCDLPSRERAFPFCAASS